MPEQIQITITSPADKVQEFITGFLASRPIPLENGIPIYTVKEWVKKNIISETMEIYRHGKRLLAIQPAVIDEDVIS